ncbi:MAG: chemotaxis protein CheW [Planctomycetota bacterium]|jgi:purine-binding chemotaxis protein CheW|nr:chemotaxis protein CheW [Planctomycetota bacterium]
MSTTPSPGVAGKYLTFRLGAEDYGLQILKVQEILGLMPVTRVPRTPSFIRGVVNLRGKVIPVVSLRASFQLEARDDSDHTCIVVVQVERDGDPVVMGVIVDEVCEVVDIAGDAIEPAPSFGSQVDTSFILGMGKLGERVVALLDIDHVLRPHDIQTVAEAAD